MPSVLVGQSRPSNLSTLRPDCIPKRLIVSKVVLWSMMLSVKTPLSLSIWQVRFLLMQAMAILVGDAATCMHVLVIQPLTLSPTFVASMKMPYDMLNIAFGSIGNLHFILLLIFA